MRSADRDAQAISFEADPRALRLNVEGDPIITGGDEAADRRRRLFELGVLQEMPYAEIARTLDIPVGTVKSRMFHAVKRLRELLERPSRKGGGGSAASNRAANRAF